MIRGVKFFTDCIWFLVSMGKASIRTMLTAMKMRFTVCEVQLFKENQIYSNKKTEILHYCGTEDNSIKTYRALYNLVLQDKVLQIIVCKTQKPKCRE